LSSLIEHLDLAPNTAPKDASPTVAIPSSSDQNRVLPQRIEATISNG
jgi:hypothetical protein